MERTRPPAPSPQKVAELYAQQAHGGVMFDVITELAKMRRSHSAKPGTLSHLVLRARVIQDMVREDVERRLANDGPDA